MTWKKFTKQQRSTFSYWLWHNLAFNYTAIKCKAWKFKYSELEELGWVTLNKSPSSSQ